MAKCRGCGKEIVWGVTEDGKKIPLDPRAAVYRFTDHGQGGPRPDNSRIIRDRNAMVTHFATCPQAGQFSRSKKKGGGG